MLPARGVRRVPVHTSIAATLTPSSVAVVQASCGQHYQTQSTNMHCLAFIRAGYSQLLFSGSFLQIMSSLTRMGSEHYESDAFHKAELLLEEQAIKAQAHRGI